MLKKKLIALAATFCLVSSMGASVSFANKTDEGNKEGDYCYEVNFEELGVTTGELKQMTYAEYYQKYFPEAWEEVFSDEEKESFENVYFLENRETAETKDIGYLLFTNFGRKDSTYWHAQSGTRYKNGTVASSIRHETYIQNSAGHGVAGSVSGTTTNTKDYVSSQSKATSTFTKGQKYRGFTTHTVKIGSTSHVKNSYSSWSVPRS